MATNSNADQFFGGLDRWLAGFDFNRKGKDQSLGRDVAMTLIRGPDVGSMGGMMGRIADEVTPDGTPWPENKSEEYKEEKARLYGWDETNRRTGQMTSQEALYGRTTIEPELVTLRYGNDTPPSVGKSPTGHISASDKRVTDVEKAMHAHDQGRGFYGVGAGDKAAVIAVAQENLDDYIRERN
jgi:hypothetical protein